MRLEACTILVWAGSPLHDSLTFAYCSGVCPVYEHQALGGTCESCVEPAEVFCSRGVGRHVALIYKYACPLTALRLVAGYGICELYLQGVVVNVFAQGFHAFVARGYVHVVCKYAFVEPVAFLCCERWRFGSESVEQYATVEFEVVVVGETECGVGKVEAVHLVEVANAHNFRRVAVGDEVEGEGFVLAECFCHLLRPEIIVFDSHHHVAAQKDVVAVEDAAADAHVIDVRLLVAACNDDGVACSAVGICF